MEVTAWQQLRFAIIDPALLDQCLAFRAMPIAARVVGYPLKGTVIALLKMTSKLSGSAHLNMMHDLGLLVWQ
jgi:hypothetical protein